MNKNFNLLFIDSEKKASEWYQDFFRLYRQNNEEKLSDLLKQAKKLYLNEFHISNIIQQLTNCDAVGLKKRKFLKHFRDCDIVQNVIEKDDKIIIKTSECNITFRKLSDIIPELREELQDWNRHGKCHEKSIYISRILAQTPNRVVTGYTYNISNIVKNLHTWVEFSIDGEEYVIDYTMNVLMNKKGYYFLLNVEPITIIADVEIRADFMNFFPYIDGFNIKEYLLFRHEILKDLQKNESVFRK